MSKTICQASVATIASTANTDEYWKICGVVAKTTDANAQIKFNSAGILSGLYVVVTANSVGTASTGTLRKNGTTDLSNVATFTASTPGSYEDTSNTDTISATDSVCMKTHPGAASGTYSISAISVIFDATTDTVTKLSFSGVNPAFTAASGTCFPNLHGGLASIENVANYSTEANYKHRMRKAGILKNFSVLASSVRAQTTAFRTRKNGSGNGNLYVPITGGGAAGWWEDTSNTDTISAGEDWNLTIVNGTGTDNGIYPHMTTEFVSTTGDGLCICVAPLGGTSVADASTLRTSIAGRLSDTTSDVAQQVKSRAAFVCSELTTLVTANDVASASSCRLRVGAANVNLVATITASTPGVYSDSTHTDTLATTSLINTNLTVPSVSGSHAVVMRNIILYTHIDPADWVITKLYFHATTSGLPAGTLPTAEQSTNTSNLNFEANQNTNRLMNVTIGSSQTSLAKSVPGSTSNTGYIARWVSPLIYQTSIAANTWTYNFAAKSSASGASGLRFPCASTNQPIWVNCYVWKPSDGTKYGTILDGNTLNNIGEGASATEVSEQATFSGSAVSNLTSGDACIVFEAWCVFSNASGNALTATYYFDGTTETVGGLITVSNHASWISTPETILWEAGTTPVNQTFSHIYKIVGRVPQTYSHKYKIVGRANATKTHKYNIKQLVNSTKTHKYKIVGRAAAIYAHIYKIVGRASATKTHKYKIGQLVNHTYTHKYKIRSLVNSTKTYIYKIRQLTNQSFSHKYKIIGRANQVFIHKYKLGQVVNRQFNAKYNIKQLVNKTYSHKYNIRALVNQTYTHIYNILAALTQVNQTFSHKYNIRALTNQTYSHKYNILVLVNATKTFKYKIVGRTSQIYSHIYNIKQLVNQQYIHKYKLVGRAMQIFAHKYNIRALINQTFSHKYKIRQLVNSTKTFKYNIKQLVNQSFSHKYNILVLVNATKTFKYKIVGRAAQTYSHIYNIKQLVNQQYSHKYKIVGRAFQSFSHIYNIKQLVNQTYSHKYKLRQLVNQSFTFKYKLAGIVSQTFTHIYNIISIQLVAYRVFTQKYKIVGRTAQTYGHRYNIKQLVANQFSHKYKIRQLVSSAKTFKYKIVGRAAQTFTHLYIILELVNNSYTYKYKIIGRAVKIYIQKYNIRQLVNSTKIHKYNIKQLVNQTYIHKYKLRMLVSQEFTHIYKIIQILLAQVSQTFTHKYAIRQLAVQSFSHKYKIRKLVSKTYNHKYNILTRINRVFSHKYRILLLVGKSFTFKYGIKTKVHQVFKHIYQIHIIPVKKQLWEIEYNKRPEGVSKPNRAYERESPLYFRKQLDKLVRRIYGFGRGSSQSG